MAARLGLGLTGDCVDLEINEDMELVQMKPALGGNVVAPDILQDQAVPDDAASGAAYAD